MKVGIVSDRYPPNVKGGGEISAHLLALGLKRGGLDVEVLSFDGPGEDMVDGIMVRREKESGSLHFPLEKGNLAGYLKIKEFCRGKDIVHGYNMKYYPATSLAAEALGLPCVLTMTTYGFYFPRKVPHLENPGTLLGSIHQTLSDSFFRHLIASRADSIIVLSSAQRRIYEEVGFPARKMKVIPNFVDRAFMDTPRSAGREKEILYVGRFSPEKGLEVLLEAFSMLEPRFGGLRLKLVGAGPLLSDLRNLAGHLGLETKVDFIGNVAYPETRRAYEKAAVFVHPGLWPEPFGRSILEAMVSGVPVVASDTGSSPEILDGCGLLFEPGNAGALASRIETLLTDSELMSELSKKARCRAESEYSENRVIDEITRTYRELVSEAGRLKRRICIEEPHAFQEGRLRGLRHAGGRLIDRTAVPTGCRLSDTYFRLFRTPEPLTGLVSPRILFVMLTRGVGDAILSTPALNQLRRRFPDSRITVLAVPYVRDLVEKFRSVDEFLEFEIENATISSFYRTVRELRRREFGLVIDILHDRSVVSSLLSFLSGARDVAGFAVGFRSVFFNHRCRMKTDGIHFADVLMGMLDDLGIGKSGKADFETDLSTQAERAFAKSMLESDSRRVICIHPGSKGISERRWPEEYWARIIDAVVQKYRCRVVMIGNENERELSKRIQKECGGQATNLAGKCTIGQTAAIIQGSDILLCGASGPLHMAVALAVSAVYIGGGVDLRRWGAYGNSPMHRAVLRDSNCRPENCHSCPDRWERCVRSITPDAVLAAVSQAMEGLTSRKQGSP